MHSGRNSRKMCIKYFEIEFIYYVWNFNALLWCLTVLPAVEIKTQTTNNTITHTNWEWKRFHDDLMRTFRILCFDWVFHTRNSSSVKRKFDKSVTDASQPLKHFRMLNNPCDVIHDESTSADEFTCQLFSGNSQAGKFLCSSSSTGLQKADKATLMKSKKRENVVGENNARLGLEREKNRCLVGFIMSVLGNVCLSANDCLNAKLLQAR